MCHASQLYRNNRRAIVCHMDSTPTIVPATRTGQTSRSRADQDAWIRSRHAALYAEMKRRGVPNAWNLAVFPVAHWGEETGWGHAEYNFNIGNIRSRGQCPTAHLIQGSDDSVPRPYCAYGSLAEGVARTFDLILAPRYAPAWQYLTSTGDGIGWFDRLLRAGWHPWSQASMNSFRSEQARVSRVVGTEPATSFWPYVATAAILIGAAALIAYPPRR